MTHDCPHHPPLSESYFHDDAVPARLDEEEYKELMRDVTKNNLPGAIVHNLPHRDWAPLIPFVDYEGTKGNIMKFFVPNFYNGWNTYVQFKEWHEQVVDPSVTPQEAAKLLLWAGNLRLHCPCPAYKFWGYKYILTQKHAAIIPEVRPPNKNNPHRLGVVCKHLNRVLKVLPFHLHHMASAIKEQRKAIERKQALQPKPATPPEGDAPL